MMANKAGLNWMALPSTQANAHGWHGCVGAQAYLTMRLALRLPKTLLPMHTVTVMV